MNCNFLISERDLRSRLSSNISRGIDFADIFCEHTNIRSMELQDSMVSQATESLICGTGIRQVTGNLQEYSLIDPIPVDSQDSGIEPTTLRDHLLNLEQKIQDIAPCRIKAAIALRDQNIMVASTDGHFAVDYRPTTSLIIRVIMEQNGHHEAGFVTESMQMSPQEFFTSERIDRLAKEAVENTRFLFDAQRIDGGEMPVVMAAGAGGILLHEAIGHAFEADFVRQGTSIFSGQLGKMICNPNINIVDDGTLLGDAGHLEYDDEGIPSQCTYLVREGRLNSFLHDRISARHFGIESTGNGRRESFRNTPQPRMRSTYMLSGQEDPQDIIRGIKRGILATQFTNGQVQIGAGDFTFYMKRGWLIEDGHLTRPLRDMNIIGNGPQALKDISHIGNDLQIAHHASMCGKGGQSVPVSQGLPTVQIDKLIVG